MLRQEVDRRFIDAMRRLPPSVPRRVRLALDLFDHDPRPPGLDFKKISGKAAPYYRIRITNDYCAIGELHGDVLQWFWVGTHADYDQFIKKL